MKHLEAQVGRFLRLFAFTALPSILGLVIAHRTQGNLILGANAVAALVAAAETTFRQAFRVTPAEQSLIAGLEADVVPALEQLASKRAAATKPTGT